MEAIAGWPAAVAHNFNNLLAVILGNLELLSPELRMVRCGSGRRWRCGAQRGADITHRLLAFSRRQALRPEALDVNAFVAEIKGVLRETVGEAVAVETMLAPNVPLALRRPRPAGGRDSRAGGECARRHAARRPHRCRNGDGDDREFIRGRRRRSARAGRAHRAGRHRYRWRHDAPRERARLRAVLHHYGSRQGLGLGLSMVYGFIVQSGGGLELDSEVGVGTTVRLYLPLSSAPAHGRPKRGAARSG